MALERGIGGESSESGVGKSTQNTQYDQIGTNYMAIKELAGVEAEMPSAIAALGSVEGKRCLDLACGTGRYTALLSSLGASSVTGYDISTTMIAGARATYPPASHPTLTFAVKDCSVPDAMQHADPFDVVFAGWFLNYAGTEKELSSMFRVVEQNLAPGGRFVGITTNVHDELMHLPKMDFYGLDILVLDGRYVAPDTGEEVGITARVVVNTETPFQFDVYQFRRHVYERCAERVGLRLLWRELVLPDDERKESRFWDRFLERPTFVIVEAVRL